MKVAVKTTHQDFIRALRVALLGYRDKAIQASQPEPADEKPAQASRQ